MAQKFVTAIDMSQLEILNAKLQNLADAPPAPVVGQIWFNTTTGKIEFRNATANIDPTDRAVHTGTQTADTISDFDDQVRTNRLDQMGIPTAPINFGGQKITNLAPSTDPGDAVSRSELETAVAEGNRKLNEVLPPDADVNLNTQKIVNLKAGTAPTDAANTAQVTAAQAAVQAEVDAAEGRLDTLEARTLDTIPAPVAPVDMTGQRLLNVGPSQAPTDGIARSELDDALSTLNTDIANKKLNEIAAPDGPVDLSTQKIVNLGEPTELTDAATVNYVQQSRQYLVDGLATVSGRVDTLESKPLDDIPLATDDVDLNNHKITNLATGTAPTDAATTAQVTTVQDAIDTLETDVGTALGDLGAKTLDQIPTAAANVNLGGFALENLAPSTGPTSAVTRAELDAAQEAAAIPTIDYVSRNAINPDVTPETGYAEGDVTVDLKIPAEDLVGYTIQIANKNVNPGVYYDYTITGSFDTMLMIQANAPGAESAFDNVSNTPVRIVGMADAEVFNGAAVGSTGTFRFPTPSFYVDGASLTSGQTALLLAEKDAAKNGCWKVIDGPAWERMPDDPYDQQGQQVKIGSGTEQGSLWICRGGSVWAGLVTTLTPLNFLAPPMGDMDFNQRPLKNIGDATAANDAPTWAQTAKMGLYRFTADIASNGPAVVDVGVTQTPDTEIDGVSVIGKYVLHTTHKKLYYVNYDWTWVDGIEELAKSFPAMAGLSFSEGELIYVKEGTVGARTLWLFSFYSTGLTKVNQEMFDSLTNYVDAQGDTINTRFEQLSLSDLTPPTGPINFAIQQINNLAPGVANTDAVNKSQLDAVQSAAQAMSLSDLAAPTAALDFAGQRVTNLGAPQNPADAARLTDIQSIANGVVWKSAVRFASTGNLPLTGLTTIDGGTPEDGDRLLLKDQDNAVENGIYVFEGGDLTRSDDGVQDMLRSGSVVPVLEGTENADTAWRLNTDEPVNIDVTEQEWGPFAQPFSIVEGPGVKITGNQVAADFTMMARRAAFTIGDNAANSFACNHQFGHTDVQVSVYLLATGEEIITDIVRTNMNTVTVGFATTPAADSHRVVVVG